MYTSLSLAMSLLPVIIIFILIQLPTSLCADDERYTNCSKPLNCSGLQDISYPFWGSDRPDYCGHPDFELNCSGEAPEITISSIKYRVLEINNSTQTLKVGSLDYWNNICPNQIRSTTLDLSLFDYASDTRNVTLFYNCPFSGSYTGGFYSFTCSSNYVNNYFWTTSSNVGTADFPSGCVNTVNVTLSQSQYEKLVASPTGPTLTSALDDGFGVQWKLDNNVCNECQRSGGLCGSQTDSDEFRCYCASGDFPSTCGSKTSGSSNKGLIAGVAAGGGAVIVLLLGCWIFCVKRKKKKVAVLSKTKELSTPPSSQSIVTPFTNLSQSIPSYPYTKSDLEKGSAYFGTQVFTCEELEQATNNFDPSRELGDGGFGTVYYGELSDGRVVAVKRLYENNFKRVGQFMNEVEILTRLKHKNLVQLYGCTSRRSKELLLVYEYIPNGTVADHLHGGRSNTGLLSWPVRLNIAVETAEALSYLHQSDIIHRDVKTNNILLDNDFCVKVADFGLSRLFPNDVTHVSTAPQGTPGYVDPEYYQCYQLTSKSDVYSFGVVLIELISSLQAVDTNRHRHDINLASMAVNKIQNREIHELVDPNLGFEKDSMVKRMATSVAELAFQCLQQERDMRPSMEQVLEVLRGIQKEELSAPKAEVVDIGEDDVGLLKNMPPPLSPDSFVVSSSTPPHSF